MPARGASPHLVNAFLGLGEDEDAVSGAVLGRRRQLLAQHLERPLVFVGFIKDLDNLGTIGR